MNKKGYKPIWTERHTKIVEEYEKKKKAGKEIFVGFEDTDSFNLYMESKLEIKEIKTDGYGNKTVIFQQFKPKTTFAVERK